MKNATFFMLFNLKSVKLGRNRKDSLETETVSREET